MKEGGHTKRDFIRSYKAEQGCAVCKEADPIVLTLAHRDRLEKIRGHGRTRGDHELSWTKLSWPLLVAELDKCDVLCRNCAARQTYADRDTVALGRARWIKSTEVQEHEATVEHLVDGHGLDPKTAKAATAGGRTYVHSSLHPPVNDEDRGATLARPTEDEEGAPS